MSNSNFAITKVTVDPTSQEITGLEVNGKAFESGGSSDEYVDLVPVVLTRLRNVESIDDVTGEDPVDIFSPVTYDGNWYDNSLVTLGIAYVDQFSYSNHPTEIYIPNDEDKLKKYEVSDLTGGTAYMTSGSDEASSFVFKIEDDWYSASIYLQASPVETKIDKSIII